MTKISCSRTPSLAAPTTSKLLKRFKEAAGLRDARFHDLRHTFGTRMAAAGAPLRFIQERMDHRDCKTTSIYADYAPDPSQGARYAARVFTLSPSLSSQVTGPLEVFADIAETAANSRLFG